MQIQFPWMRFHRVWDRPIGPHPQPMWEADFARYENKDKWREVVAFVEKEREGVTVLIHPHSEDGHVADHTRHAYWAGAPLKLIFKKSDTT